MAEENPPRVVPETGKDSPIDPSVAASSMDRDRNPPLRRTPKRRRNLVILIVIAVVLVAGILLWRYLSSYESTDDAQGDLHLYPVSARVSGYVVRVNVDDNQWVEKGTVLVEVDPKDYEVAVARSASQSRQCRRDRPIAEYHGSHYLGKHIKPTEVHQVRHRRR